MINHNPFYNQRAWRRASRKALVKAGFKCRRCGADISQAYNVHHHKAVRSRPDLALETINHVPLCLRCHKRIETGVDRRIGADINGFPIGPDHPWNLWRSKP